MTEGPRLRQHEDRALFREALAFTTAESGFASRLIEKDYYCTVILRYLSDADAGLVFRGGTCLAKVHSGFHRLSEDLDFLVSMPVHASRQERRARAAAAKAAVAAIGDRVPGLRPATPLTGANQSTQYTAAIEYRSALTEEPERVKVDLGLREPLLTPSIEGGHRTLLLDPVSGGPSVPLGFSPCVSSLEAMAEKVRAALTRREVAIRDFYDIDHAARSSFDLFEQRFLDLVRGKLSVPGNELIDMSPARLAALQRQLRAQLEPVLRPSDYAGFDLDRAVARVVSVAQALT